jgi:hypothetical protein
MNVSELERALHHLRAAAAIGTPFERQFARDILARARNGRWRATQKQTAVIRRIVADQLADNFEVIERCR